SGLNATALMLTPLPGPQSWDWESSVSGDFAILSPFAAIKGPVCTSSAVVSSAPLAAEAEQGGWDRVRFRGRHRWSRRRPQDRGGPNGGRPLRSPGTRPASAAD